MGSFFVLCPLQQSQTVVFYSAARKQKNLSIRKHLKSHAKYVGSHWVYGASVGRRPKVPSSLPQTKNNPPPTFCQAECGGRTTPNDSERMTPTRRWFPVLKVTGEPKCSRQKGTTFKCRPYGAEEYVQAQMRKQSLGPSRIEAGVSRRVVIGRAHEAMKHSFVVAGFFPTADIYCVAFFIGKRPL